MITTAIVEDNAELRKNWAEFINSSEGFACIGNFPSCETALESLSTLAPDVLLLDIEIPGYMSGIEGIHYIRKITPSTQILMLTIHSDERHVFDALRAGAFGYLLKDSDPDRLLQAARMAVAKQFMVSPKIARKIIDYFSWNPNGHHDMEKYKKPMQLLTDRQLQVLEGICEGLTQKEIADRLDVKPFTINHHVKQILERLQAANAAEAAFKAGRWNLFSGPQ